MAALLILQRFFFQHLDNELGLAEFLQGLLKVVFNFLTLLAVKHFTVI
jgi:hypothetical protein